MRNNFIILLICWIIAFPSAVMSQSGDAKSRIAEIESELESASGTAKIPLYCEMAELYARHNTNKALKLIQEADKIASKQKASPSQKADIYDGYGSVYYFKKNYKQAASYYDKAFAEAKKGNLKKKMAYAQFNAGIAYKALKQYKKAVADFNASLRSAKIIKDNSLAIQNYHALYETYNLTKDYKLSLDNYQLYINSVADNAGKKSGNLTVLTSSYKGETKMKLLTESEVINTNALLDEMDSTISEMAMSKDSLEQVTETKAQEIDSLSRQNLEQSHNLEQREAEISTNKDTIDKQQNIIMWFIIIGAIVLALLGVVFYMFSKIKRINSRLENQKSEIESQKNLIQVKNEQITDSINYARKIQDSILVPENKIKRWLPQMFIYYKPKDIVSGDFYWFSKFENKYVITAIDCTGHGVPGAFLSMIGNTLLHEIVNIKHVFKPDEILTMLHTGITLALNQESEDSGSEDGMDMSLCTVDTKQHRFQFAGAKNNLYVVQGDKLKILKANYYSIGGKPLRPDMKVEFTSYDFMYDDNTSIYMFSDGYLDQFGGDNDEKFNTTRFKEMILANRKLPMEQQKEILAKTMEEWKGDRQQIDDFLVMGVKLSDLGGANIKDVKDYKEIKE